MIIEMIGRRFGKWVVDDEEDSIGGHKMWVCLCDCGEYSNFRGDHLRAGKVNDHACTRKSTVKRAALSLKLSQAVRDGRSRVPGYFTWAGIARRCNDPDDPAYKNYGGRGITVCERWADFPNFMEDMGPKPEGTEIDRIDNNDGYYKENCRWTTRKQNTRNRRNTCLVTYQGETLSAPEWSERLGMSSDNITKRIARGWSAERALTAPPMGSDEWKAQDPARLLPKRWRKGKAKLAQKLAKLAQAGSSRSLPLQGK